jgi:uncharacterized protein YqgC (DUF456 family)
MQPSTDLFLLAYLLMFLGVVGAILPVMPGPLFIWLGTLLWAWVDGFQAIGWPTLALLAILMVLAWSSDLILTTAGSRRAGASWKAMSVALVGATVGGILLSGMAPVLGTIFGAISGGVIGILAVEYFEKRDWGHAFRAARGYIVGSLAASGLELFLSLLMIAIFAWQVFS